MDTLLEVSQNKPILGITPERTTCPYCFSYNIKDEGECASCNHSWWHCQCSNCDKKFVKQVKYNKFDKFAITWYTKDKKVLRGIPGCFENYILTCKCGNDLIRKRTKLDGVTTDDSGLTYWDGKKFHHRTFYVCDSCNNKTEYPQEYWSPSIEDLEELLN
jgi:hypothetical protein